jgi:hypothetical protein
MFLLFLNNPHQASLSLKPSAELLLGHAPEERDAVGEWLLKNQPVPFVKISKSKQSPHYYMGYVKYAEDQSSLVMPMDMPIHVDRQYKQLELKPWV